jgi:hypothetical protein
MIRRESLGGPSCFRIELHGHALDGLLQRRRVQELKRRDLLQELLDIF